MTDRRPLKKAAGHQGARSTVPPRLQTILVNLAIAAFGLSPVVLSLATRAYASHVGCELGDAVHPCLLDGEDIGRRLHALGMAWAAILFTLPLSLTIAVVYNIFNRQRGSPS